MNDVRNAMFVLLERGRAEGRENGTPAAHVFVGILEHERVQAHDGGYRASSCAGMKYRGWGAKHGTYVGRI
jgi:hypothetical protein